MPTLTFTQQLSRFTEVPQILSSAMNLSDALQDAFHANPRLRGYILDEQDHVRQHVTIFIDGVRLTNKTDLSVSLQSDSQVYVLQALSGG